MKEKSPKLTVTVQACFYKILVFVSFVNEPRDYYYYYQRNIIIHACMIMTTIGGVSHRF